MHPLQKNDFPLIAVGANVYRRTMSSPLFTAPSPALAEELAFRLNRDDTSGFGYRDTDATIGLG